MAGSEVFRLRAEMLTQMADEFSHSDAEGASEVTFLLRRTVKLVLAIGSGEKPDLAPLPVIAGEEVSDVRPG